MTQDNTKGKGTKENPWMLQTPPGTSEYTLYRDEAHNPPVLVCTVGKTVLLYDLRCIEDLHTMLKKHGDWMELGSADEQKPAKDDSHHDRTEQHHLRFGCTNQTSQSCRRHRGRLFGNPWQPSFNHHDLR